MTNSVISFDVNNRPPGTRGHHPDRQAVEDAFAALLPVTEPVCVDQVFTIPLKMRGAFSSATTVYRASVVTAGTGKDRDRLVLRCDPSSLFPHP